MTIVKYYYFHKFKKYKCRISINSKNMDVAFLSKRGKNKRKKSSK
jgi:hypothetical protein